MSRVITFSRQFPAYHPRKGESTNFVEKTVKSLHLEAIKPWDIPDEVFNEEIYHLVDPKYHTIRKGNRWKVGDKFSPRVWSGKPYCSPMITIAPDIEIKQVWDVEVDEDLAIWVISNDAENDSNILEKLALNDGLALPDLLSWFNKPMTGQIICWSDKIDY